MSAVAVRRDPAKRSDGRCANPGCTKKVPTKPPKTMLKALRPMYLEALAREPFCSAECCRAHWGNPIRSDSIWAVHHGVGS